MEFILDNIYYLIYVYVASLIAILFMFISIASLKKNKIENENYIKQLENNFIDQNKSIQILEINKNIDKEKITQLEEKLKELDQLKERNITEKFALQRDLDLTKLRYENIQTNFAEWQKLKEESVNNAKAAIFEVGNQLSNKLIEDHKREAEEAKKINLDLVNQTTEQLYTQFQNIINSVASISDQVQKSNISFDKIKKSLLSPTGAGSLAEITLENILKASGLVTNKDYIMQFSVADEENKKLRPDAVIFLPANNIMIIDSKASKFFVNFEEEYSDEIVKDKIKNITRTHLKDLVSKEYIQYVKDHVEKTYNFKVNYISMIMFLPSESALEKIQSVDAKFILDSWERNIYPAGPIGLINILSHAKFVISEQDKIDNHHDIIKQLEKLLISFSKIYEYTGKIGSNLHAATKNFDKLAASFNSNLTPKIKNLEKLGLTNLQSVKFKKMDRLQFVTDETLDAIEREEEFLLEENS